MKTMMVTKRRVIMAITILNLDSGFIFSCNEVLFVELQLFVWKHMPEHGRNDAETFNIRKTLMVEANIIARKSCWLNIICVNNIIRHNIHTRCHGFFPTSGNQLYGILRIENAYLLMYSWCQPTLFITKYKMINLFIYSWEFQKNFV